MTYCYLDTPKTGVVVDKKNTNINHATKAMTAQKKIRKEIEVEIENTRKDQDKDRI